MREGREVVYEGRRGEQAEVGHLEDGLGHLISRGSGVRAVPRNRERR